MSGQETGVLGQCVYTMSTGKRCQRDAKAVLRYGSFFQDDLPAYGYCPEHHLAVTKPRDPRIHRTAEPLVKIEGDPTPTATASVATASDEIGGE